MARLSVGSERGCHCMFRRPVDQEFLLLVGLPLLGSAVQWLSVLPWVVETPPLSLHLLIPYVHEVFLDFLCEFTRLRGAADALDSWAQLCEDARRSEPLTLSPAPLRGETRRNVSLRRSVPFVPSSASAVRIWGASRFCMFCRLIHVHWVFFFFLWSIDCYCDVVGMDSTRTPCVTSIPYARTS